MNVLVCGDRNWNNYYSIYSFMSELLKWNGLFTIISGEAKGADALAKKAADDLRILYAGFEADWDKYGKAAGPIRNKKMIDEGKPDLVVAFHSNISKSKGTRDMITKARDKGIPIIIKEY